MKINRAEFQSALEKVKPGLANRELIEQSTSFAFIGNRVVTYNDEISISYPIKGLDIQGAVKAQALYEFLRKVKKEELELEVEENQVKISAGRTTAGLVFEQEIKLPIDEIGKIEKWRKLPEGFVDVLKFCHPCCSHDMSRAILTCVHVKRDSIEASDSFQIVQHKLKTPIKSMLIPANAVRDLVRYEIIEVAEGEGWSHFHTTDDLVFSCRVLEGEFPDISTHLDFEGTELQFPKSLAESLDRAQIFSRSDEDMPVAVVEVSAGQVKVSATNEFGWFEETARTRYKGDPVRFTTNVEFLRNLLNQESVCVYGENRIKFTGADWVHVVATMAAPEGEK